MVLFGAMYLLFLAGSYFYRVEASSFVILMNVLVIDDGDTFIIPLMMLLLLV